MAITTYTELLTAIANWMDDAGLGSYDDDFVALGQKRLKRDLRLRQMVKRATATMSTSDRYLALPTGYVGIKQFQLNTDPLRTLEFVPEDTINLYHSATAGKPHFFTVTGSEFQFEKTPDSAYTAEITFYKHTDITSSTATNETFPEFAELYLQAALIEGLYFVQETERAQQLEGRYQYLLRAAEQADMRSKMTEGTLVAKPDFYE